MYDASQIAGVAARVFEWGGQKVDKILNLPHYAWMTDKIVRPKENNDKNYLNKNKQIIMIILFAKIANKNDLNDTCYVFH